MGILGALAGGAIGLVTGGLANMVAGAVAGYGVEEAAGGGGSSTVVMPPPVDYSAALLAASDNAKTTSLAQINGQMMTLRQGTMNAELQRAANLELNLEKFDTKLQTSQLQFLQGMKHEENRHVEEMAAALKDHEKLVGGSGSASASSGDLPLPEIEAFEREW